LRVAVCTRSPNTDVEPTIAAAVEELGRWLAERGHHVEVVEPPPIGVDEFLPVFQRQSTLAPVLREAALQPVTRWLRAAGRKVSAERARAVKQGLERRILAWAADVDLVLTPTVGFFPLVVDATRGLAAEDAFARLARCGAFTAAANITGQPAASIPAGVTEDGLAYAVQLIARRGEDVALLRLCREIEQARPWLQCRAPMAAR